jgi:hypothetical protein
MPAAKEGKFYKVSYERKDPPPPTPVPDMLIKATVKLQADVIGHCDLNVPHVMPHVTFSWECASPDVKVWLTETTQKWVKFCLESQQDCNVIVHVRISEGLTALKI